ncbi:hypothetical protein LINPERPRIM_LOCUS28899 [Linum perenne]
MIGLLYCFSIVG